MTPATATRKRASHWRRGLGPGGMGCRLATGRAGSGRLGLVGLRVRVVSGSGSGRSPGLRARLAKAMDVLSAVVAELDPDCVDGRDATDLYGSFAGMERLAVAGKTLLAPRIESSLVWRDTGHRNAAVLLADLEGVSTGQAGATLSLGRRLEALPGTQEEVRKGTLSTPKVAELVDAGVVDPGRELDLVAGAADAPLQAVKERCRKSRATAAGDRSPGRCPPYPRLPPVHLVDRRRGGLLLPGPGHGRPGGPDPQPPGTSRHLPAQGGQGGRGPGRTGTGLHGRRLPCPPHRGSPPVPSSRPGPGSQPTAGRSVSTRGGPLPLRPRRPGPKRPGPRKPGPRRPAAEETAVIDRPPACSVVVRVDLAALLRGRAHPGECCAIDNVGPIPVPMARSMANDSYLRYLFHQAGDIRAVSHFGRTINRSLRTALLHRDPHLCGPRAVGSPPASRSTTSSPLPKADQPPSTIWPGSVTTTISSRPTRDGTSPGRAPPRTALPSGPLLPHPLSGTNRDSGSTATRVGRAGARQQE